VDFQLDATAEALRVRVRTFLSEHGPGRPPRDRAERRRWERAWWEQLAEHGMAGPAWPRQWGGMELSVPEQVAYHEEMARARVPGGPPPLRIVGPTILRFGTPAQRDRYLPPMLTGAEEWCLGYSEPGSGSDLASLSTAAIRDGGEYVVNGQKVWTSNSMTADLMAALVRTGTPAARQDGITYLIIDMRTPGIVVRPLQDMAGDKRFSEVFFDDVRVPAENVVGDVNGGWRVTRTALGFERSTANTARDLAYRRVLDDVVALAHQRSRAADPAVRQELAQLETSFRLVHLNNLRILSSVMRGDDPGLQSSVTRLMHSLFEKRLHELAVDLLGPNALLGGRDPLAADRGKWAWGFLRTRASTIGAGTAEVQRNVIAERVLGLPHEPDAAIMAGTTRSGAPRSVENHESGGEE
jgi:alkylation response protein AidB-like acyl-CoA dehydrogenase